MKRKTIQRTLVLEMVNKLKCHATADEVYDSVVKEHPNISRGTVYRNLNQLSADGEIRKVEIPGGADRFDHFCNNHYHAICTCCGCVFDVDVKYMDGLENSIHDSSGFQFVSHDIIFKGICSKCTGHLTD